MPLVWGPHFQGTGLSHYQLLRPIYGLVYHTIKTRSFLPQGRSGQSKAWGRTWISVGGGEIAKRQRSTELVGGMEDNICLLPRLGPAPEVRDWDRREAGKPREVWGHAEQRLGLGRGPGAPDLWGWKQWLGRCCLAGCLGTSLLSFPAPSFATLLARSLSSGPSCPLAPGQHIPSC